MGSPVLLKVAFITKFLPLILTTILSPTIHLRAKYVSRYRPYTTYFFELFIKHTLDLMLHQLFKANI